MIKSIKTKWFHLTFFSTIGAWVFSGTLLLTALNQVESSWSLWNLIFSADMSDSENIGAMDMIAKVSVAAFFMVTVLLALNVWFIWRYNKDTKVHNENLLELTIRMEELQKAAKHQQIRLDLYEKTFINNELPLCNQVAMEDNKFYNTYQFHLSELELKPEFQK